MSILTIANVESKKMECRNSIVCPAEEKEKL
jgi:hypothetical protein